MSATARAVLGLLVGALLLLGVGVGAFAWLRQQGLAAPVPGEERCVATAGGGSVALDLDQAHFTSIIIGVSVRRGLPARAASIAMAAAYQETGIRNLDYGDRDSVGLFQQRPSQGWGTEAQLQDPYYATGKFFDALVKIKGWRTGDINDVAQQVQRSGHPQAYRDHVADARVLASAFTGQTPAALTCLDRTGHAGDLRGLRSGLAKTFGASAGTVSGRSLVVTAKTSRLAWAYGVFAMANASRYGTTEVTVGGRVLTLSELTLSSWAVADDRLSAEQVKITVR